jgi:hypothetical protein
MWRDINDELLQRACDRKSHSFASLRIIMSWNDRELNHGVIDHGGSFDAPPMTPLIHDWVDPNLACQLHFMNAHCWPNPRKDICGGGERKKLLCSVMCFCGRLKRLQSTIHFRFVADVGEH